MGSSVYLKTDIDDIAQRPKFGYFKIKIANFLNIKF